MRGLPVISHVNPNPDPKYLWKFEEGQTRTIGVDPFLSFRVDKIGADSLDGTMKLDEKEVVGKLEMNRPVVLTRKAVTKEAMVTVTLRLISTGAAYLQVTANPIMEVGYRQ